MLESLVTSLLNQYLGMFIEGLDPEQLQMNVWSGEVDLQNLKLKSSCLDQLHLPIKLKAGSVGRLRLALNWAKLSSEPVKVELSDIYLISELEKVHTFEEAVERTNALQDKLMKLKAMEEFELSFGDVKTDDSFVAALSQKIIDNLQISVKRVHFRFESAGFRGYTKPMALGLFLQEFTAVTTDAMWRPMFVADESVTYKKVVVQNFALYLSTKPQHARPTKVALMEGIFGTKTVEYLLAPVSGYLQLTSNKKDVSPKINIKSELGSINFRLGEGQYHALLAFLSALANEQEQIQYELGKIDIKFREGTEADRKRYIALYKRTLNATWLPELTEEELVTLQELDAEVSYQDLAEYRTGAFAEVSRELGGKRVTKRPKGSSGGWLSSWWGGSSEAESPPEAHLELTEQDRESIYEAVKGSSREFKPEKKQAPDFVLVNFSYHLREFGLALCASEAAGGGSIIHLTATDSQINFRMHPGSMVLEAKLHTLSIRDDFTPDSLHRHLLKCSAPESRSQLSSPSSSPTTPITTDSVAEDTQADSPATSTSGKKKKKKRKNRGSEATSSPPFVQMSYEGRPLDAKGKLDARLKLKLLPHQLVLHGRLLNRISRFFTASQEVDLHVFSKWSLDQFDQVLLSTQSSLADSLEKHSAIDIQVDLEAPTLLVPVDPCKKSGDMLVCGLGCIRLDTFNQDKDELRKTTKGLKWATTFTPEDSKKLYDRFKLHVSNIQVQLVKWRDWQPLQEKEEGEVENFDDFILMPIDINLAIDKCAVTDFPSLPNIKVSGKLPLLSISLSSSQYHRLLRLAASFAAPVLPPQASPSRLAELPAASPSKLADLSSSQSPNKLEMGELSVASPYMRAESSIDFASASPQVPRRPSLSRSLSSFLSPKSESSMKKLGDSAELSFQDLVELLGTEAKAQDVMKKLDFDGDGSVTRKEFDKWWLAHKAELKSHQVMDLSFLLPKMELVISDDSKGDALPVLKVEVTGIEMAVKKLYFDSNVKLSIHSVQLLEQVTGLGPLIQTTGAPSKALSPSKPATQPRAALSPASQSDDFLRINYKSVAEESPDWQNVDSTLDVAAGSVILRLNPNSLKVLAIFFVKVFLRDPEAAVQPQEPLAPQTPARLSRATSSSVAGGTADKQSPGGPVVFSPPTSDPTRQKLRAQFNFASIHIFLLVYQREQLTLLSEIAVSGFQTKFLQRTSTIDVGIGLRSCSVIDRTPLGRSYPDIVKSLTDETTSSFQSQAPLVKISYRTFEQVASLDPAAEAGATAELRIELSRLRTVFLNRYVQELLHFATAGPMEELQTALAEGKSQPQQANADSAQVVALTPRKLELEPAELPKKAYTKIEIVLSGVDLVVPETSSSQQQLLVALDRVAVSNSLQTTEAATFDRYTVRVNEFSTRSVIFRRSQAARRVESFLLRVKDVCTDLDLAPNNLNVAVGIEGVELKLAQRQYQLLMSTLAGNLKEQADMLPALTAREQKLIADAKEATSAAAASAAASAASSVFRIRLSMPNIALTLLEEYGVEDLDRLLQLELRSFGVQLSSSGDGLDFHLKMNNVQLRDLSRVGSHVDGQPVLAPYRHLVDLTPCSEDGKVAPLSVRFKQSAVAREITVSLERLHFTMGKVILELPNFFASPDQAAAAATSDTRSESESNQALTQKEDDAQLEEEKQVSEKPETSPPLPLKVTLKIQDAMLQLVADPTRRFSSALSLAWSLHTEINTLPGHFVCVLAVLEDVEVFVAELDSARSDFVIQRHSRDAAEAILMPVSAKAKVDVRSSQTLSGEQSLNVRLYLADVRSCFTYTSYQIFLTCLKTLGKNTSELSQSVKESAPTPQVAAPAIASFGEQRVEVEVCSVHVELINNVLGTATPLAQLAVKHLTLDVLGYKHQRNVDLRTGFAVSYFNNAGAAWEPLLEPWQFQMTATQVNLVDLSVRRQPAPLTVTILRLGSNHNMELNLTASMIKSLLDTLDVLTLAHDKLEARTPEGEKKLFSLRSPTSAGFAEFKPFLLINQTEFSVQFQATFADSAGSKSGLGPPNTVAAWSECPIEVPKNVPPGSSASVAINIQQAHGWPALKVSLSKVGVWKHTLTSEDTGQTVTLVSEMKIVHGVKQVSLHSTRGVRNETSTTLRVQCSAQVQASCLDSLPLFVAPGGSLWLPLCAGHESKSPVSLRFKPVDHEGKARFAFSEDLKLTHPMQNPAGWKKGRPFCLLHCAADEKSSALNFALSVSLVRSKYSSLLVLRAPFVLKNGLVCAITARACGASGGHESASLQSADDTLVEANHVAALHAVAGDKPQLLRLALQFPTAPPGWVKLPGWSAVTDFELEALESKQITTPCGQAEVKLCVTVKTYWEKGQLHVPVTVPFWLIDATSDNLEIVGELQNKKQAFHMSAGDVKQQQVVMFNTPQQPGKETRVSILTRQGWSTLFPFRLGVSSLAGPNREELGIGFQTSLANTKFPETKMITFAPKYILVNRTGVPLSVAQLQVDEQGTLTTPHPDTVTIEPHSQLPFLWPIPTVHADKRLLVVRREGKEFAEWLWSGAFSPDKVTQREMMVRHQSEADKVWFCRVETRVRGPSLFTVITTHPEAPSPALYNLLPFRIDNRSVRERIQFCQILDPQVRQTQSEKRWMQVDLHSSVPFALEETSQPAVLCVRVGFRGHAVKGPPRFERTFVLELQDLDTSMQIKIPLVKSPPHAVPRAGGSCIYVFMETEGPVRVVVFSDFANPLRSMSEEGETASEKKVVDPRVMLKYRLFFHKVVLQDVDLLEQHRFTVQTRLQAVLHAQVQRPAELPQHVAQVRVEVFGGKNLAYTSFVTVRFENGSLEHRSETAQGPCPTWQDAKSQFIVPPFDVMGDTLLEITVWRQNLLSEFPVGKLRWRLKDLSTYQPSTNWFDLNTANPDAGSIQVMLWWVAPGVDFLQAQLDSIEACIKKKRDIVAFLQNEAHQLNADVQQETRLQNAAIAGRLSFIDCADAFREAQLSRIELSLLSLLGVESLLPQDAPVRHGFSFFRFRFTRTRFSGRCFQLEQLLLFRGRTQLEPSRVYNPGGRSARWEEVTNLMSNESNKFVDQLFQENGHCTVIFEFDQPTFATEAVLKTAKDLPGRDPKDFTVEASVDRERWLTLAKVVNASGPTDRRAYYPAVLLNPFAGLPGRLECLVCFPLTQREAAVVLWRGELDPITHDVAPYVTFYVPDQLMALRPPEQSQLLLQFRYRTELKENQTWASWQTVAELALPAHDLPLEPGLRGEFQLDASGLRSDKCQWVEFDLKSASSSSSSSSVRPKLVVSLNRYRARKHNYRPTLHTEIALRHVGVSVVNETPEEMLYFHLSRFCFTFADSPSEQSFNLTLGHAQLDNQQAAPVFRVVMAPIPLSEELWQPFLQSTAIKEKESQHVQVFDYVTLLLQGVELKVEEELIYDIVNLVNHLLSETKQQEVVVPTSVALSELLAPPAGDTELYFESFHLQPISAKISFEASPGMRGQMEGATYNPIKILLSVAGNTLGNLNEVPLKLTGQLVTNVRGETATILPALVQRYVSDLLGQLHNIIGSLELIGNPVGLLNELGSGVHDAFYEPYRGLVKSPKDFALGVEKGGKALLLSVFGFAGSFSMISRSIGKGAATLSMDEKFVSRLEQKAKPKNAVDGLVSATRSLGSGVVSAVTGVVFSPLEGARRDGISGFLQGVFLGVTGLVVKPVSGILTALGQVLAGVESSARAALTTQVQNRPYRKPRQFSQEQTLILYKPSD
eukprot:g68077.t1